MLNLKVGGHFACLWQSHWLKLSSLVSPVPGDFPILDCQWHVFNIGSPRIYSCTYQSWQVSTLLAILLLEYTSIWGRWFKSASNPHEDRASGLSAHPVYLPPDAGNHASPQSRIFLADCKALPIAEKAESGEAPPLPKTDPNPIVICGFGQLGQTVANMIESPLAVSLESRQMPYIAFDHRADRCNSARAAGFNVTYGNGSANVSHLSSWP